MILVMHGGKETHPRNEEEESIHKYIFPKNAELLKSYTCVRCELYRA